MKDLLTSIGLLRDFSVTLNCPKSYFMKTLGENTRQGKFELFEPFTSGPPFKGKVESDQFKIRLRRTILTSRQYMVKVKGTVIERNERAVIAMEANGFNWFLMYFWSILVLGLISLTVVSLTEDGFPGFVLPIFIAQVLLVGLIPYFILRRAVGNTIREIEKEFHFITRDYKGSY